MAKTSVLAGRKNIATNLNIVIIAVNFVCQSLWSLSGGIIRSGAPVLPCCPRRASDYSRGLCPSSLCGKPRAGLAV